MSDVEDVIIIGSGPAGYTAALYTARANLRPLVFEGFAWGGLLQQTTDVENYPGFPEGVMGPEMMQKFRDQAERFGARLETEEAERVELATSPAACTGCGSARRSTPPGRVVLAMGAEHKKLDVQGEADLSGRGVSYCATCDAAFFKGAPTLIVGGGDSAMEEAVFLSKFASRVTIVHRRPEFRASKIMLERARSQPNIDFLVPYRVSEFAPGENGALGHATLVNTETGEEQRPDGVGKLHRDRPRAPVRARARPGGRRRERLRGHRGPLDTHQPAGRVRRRRPRRPHLPPGDHGGRIGLSGGAGRRVVPARHPRGAEARRDARRRPRAGGVDRDGQDATSERADPALDQRSSAPSSSSRKRFRSSPPP